MVQNNLREFTNEELGKIRLLIGENDLVLFNLYDVAIDLGYTKNNAVRVQYLRKDRIENIAQTLDITGVSAGDTNIKITKDTDFENTYITEEAFYDICLESKAKNARKFRKWVTSEVLPTIRQTGGYVKEGNEEEFIKNYFPSFSDEVKQAMVLDLRKKNEAYRKQLEEQKHLVAFANHIEFSKASITMKEFADLMNIKKFGRNKMMEWLRNNKYLNNKNEPYRQYIDQGIFETKEKSVDLGNTGESKIQITTFITGKGQTYLYEKITESLNVAS